MATEKARKPIERPEPAGGNKYGPGRGAKVGAVRQYKDEHGRQIRAEVVEVRQLPGGFVAVIEHGREVV